MEDAPSVRSDAERNRRTLLDAAASALSSDPDASLGEVARIAGLARATLYRHFSSRDMLLAALRDDALACASQVVADARVGEGAALDALHRVISGVVAFGARFRPLLMDGAGQDPAFLRRRTEAFMPVVAIVRRGQRDGEIRADASVEWIVTALTALLTAAVRMQPAPSQSQTVELVFGTLVAGIRETQPGRN